MPHVGHLIVVCAFGLAAAVNPLWPLLLAAAGLWLFVWGAHTAVNWISTAEPFRCHQCGSTPATPAAVADATEAQRLQAAMAKAAAMKARASV